MSILKKIVEFIRAKLFTTMANNLTVEDQYASAASKLIDKITQLKVAHEKSKNEEIRVRRLAKEKDGAAVKKEKEIRALMAQGVDVTTHAKLGILYRRTASALHQKADDYKGMRSEIEAKVVELDDAREDLATKLELIRETRAANDLGVASAEDVIEIAGLAKIDVEDTLMRVETFNGTQHGTETTSVDIQEYLDSLK